MPNEKIEQFIKTLPDENGVRRFYAKLSAEYPSEAKRLEKNQGLLSDVLTIAAFSPLLATTLLQNPEYISWLNTQRKSSVVREKEELLESLARFALMNSQVETNVLLSRFRRRELIRIYLKDIRNLGTIAEITEEISNLADAILEYALNLSRQELDNRYGIPLEIDEKNKTKQAKICIVSLGKLGSKELNYSSDIDLLFLYSNDGTTSGQGTRGAVTNKEYFNKLAEFVSNIVGKQIGEGAAYRVDLRLRPHGRVGALAISLKEAENYYKKSAQMWEKQVLIRSRSSAGDAQVFHNFFASVESSVFSNEITVAEALENVKQSKDKINFEKSAKNGFDVKLGKGGIREIEFIAQALQLGKGGSDQWLRSQHTLISLTRLADRHLLSETELTKLSDAYAFLRKLEHRLQMENGLQTHFLADDLEKRLVISQRMGIDFVADFNVELEKHKQNVNQIFTRIFEEEFVNQEFEIHTTLETKDNDIKPLLTSIEKSDVHEDIDDETIFTLKTFAEISPMFFEMLQANPKLLKNLPNLNDKLTEKNYLGIFHEKVLPSNNFAESISLMRKIWAGIVIEIAFFDVFEKADIQTIRRLQTKLAEASIEIANVITKRNLETLFDKNFDEFPFAVLGLGKLGGGGMDYGSDLDLVLVYDDEKPCPIGELTHAQFYAKATEIFVTTLSSLTRDGSLYRVDLRLRPDGKNGATSIGKNALFNYLENRSAIWEWLAYVKLRGVGGDLNLAKSAEETSRKIIYQNAQKSLISDFKFQSLREETKRIRERLATEKSTKRKGKEIDIKFGEGGLQDVYFAIRYLQLKDNLPDIEANRSTLFSLQRLYENNSLSTENFENLAEGYKFLSELDHNLRLTVGRSTRLPIANHKSLKVIACRMKCSRVEELLERLTFHRLNIHSAFEDVLNKH